MHFFLSDPDRYPLSGISISAGKLKGLLANLLYDDEKIKAMQDAQEKHFEKGENNTYTDLIDLLGRKSNPGLNSQVIERKSPHDL